MVAAPQHFSPFPCQFWILMILDINVSQPPEWKEISKTQPWEKGCLSSAKD